MSEITEVYMSPVLIEKFKIACQFIAEASIEQRACLLNEIMIFNDFMAWNAESKQLLNIENIAINGDCFQLNIEVENE